MLGGVLLLTACNAGSYFLRTQSVADLVDENQNVTESLGFPTRVWLEASSSNSGEAGFDFTAAGINLLFGVMLGSVFGAIGIKYRHGLNRKLAEFEKKNSNTQSKGYQFSIIGLLLLTTLVAALTATVINYLETPPVIAGNLFRRPGDTIGVSNDSQRHALESKGRDPSRRRSGIDRIGFVVWADPGSPAGAGDAWYFCWLDISKWNFCILDHSRASNSHGN